MRIHGDRQMTGGDGVLPPHCPVPFTEHQPAWQSVLRLGISGNVSAAPALIGGVRMDARSVAAGERSLVTITMGVLIGHARGIFKLLLGFTEPGKKHDGASPVWPDVISLCFANGLDPWQHVLVAFEGGKVVATPELLLSDEAIANTLRANPVVRPAELARVRVALERTAAYTRGQPIPAVVSVPRGPAANHDLRELAERIARLCTEQYPRFKPWHAETEDPDEAAAYDRRHYGELAGFCRAFHVDPELHMVANASSYYLPGGLTHNMEYPLADAPSLLTTALFARERAQPAADLLNAEIALPRARQRGGHDLTELLDQDAELTPAFRYEVAMQLEFAAFAEATREPAERQTRQMPTYTFLSARNWPEIARALDIEIAEPREAPAVGQLLAGALTNCERSSVGGILAMLTGGWLPFEVVLPEDFDDVLGVLYGKTIHPKNIIELACNLASALEDYDVSTAQVEQVALERNVVVLTPKLARVIAVEAVQLQRAECAAKRDA